MKIIKNILLTLFVLAALVVVIGLLLPASTQVERSIVIKKAPASVFPFLNDFRKFVQWSPWTEKDKNIQFEFSGPANGVGAKMHWESASEGSGSQEIVASQPEKRVDTVLHFTQGTAEAYYLLAPEQDGTHLTWGFKMQFGYNIVRRYFGLMFDQWIGASYEQGLRKLKSQVENN